MAHKWSQAGAMGPTDTNYYWQLADASTTDPSGTAQYGASEFGEFRTQMHLWP